MCGRKAPKRELIRVVRAPDGTVAMDATGRKAGRGAYLCSNEACWQEVAKGDRLSHALRGNVSLDDRKRLLALRVQMEDASSSKEMP